MKKSEKKWNWWLVLLWAYATIVSLIISVPTILFPGWVNNSPPTSETETLITGAIMFLPLTVFLFIVGIRNFRDK